MIALSPPIPWLNGLRVVRAMMVLDLLGWVWLLLRPHFSFDGNHGYDLLAYWGLPGHWAAVFLLAALAASLTGRVRWRPLRAGSAGLCTLMEAALAVSFTFGPHVTTGAPTHWGMALGGAWLVWRELSA